MTNAYPDCGIDYKDIFIQLQKDCLFWGEAFYIALKTCAPMIGIDIMFIINIF